MPQAKANVARGEETRNKIAAMIRRWHAERGFSPTAREIADELDLSTTVTQRHIDKMEREGRLIREGPRTTRGYSMVVHW